MECQASLIDEKYFECMDTSERDFITDSTIYYKYISDYMVYCERFAPEDEKDPLTEYQKMVQEQERRHRQQAIEMKFPEREKVEFDTPQAGFRKLLQEMCNGRKVLCDFPAFHKKLKVYFDILEKKDSERSMFGNYHYVVKRITTAEILKDYHITQGGFCNYLLGKIQEYTPPKFYIINRDHEEIPIKYNEEEIRSIIGDIRAIFNRGREVVATYDCAEWPWKTYINKMAKERGDISLVEGVGQRLREELFEKGITTVNELLKAKKENLVDETLIKKAEAIKSGNHIFLEPVAFPKKKIEMFLNLEYIDGKVFWQPSDYSGNSVKSYSCNLVTICYLIGVFKIEEKEKKEIYKSFFANHLNKGGEVFFEFMEWLSEQEDYVIYHFYQAEKVILEKLAKRYGFPNETVEEVKENMIDLHKKAARSFMFPLPRDDFSHHIQYTKYTEMYPEMDKNECIALFFKCIENPKVEEDIHRKISKYNEDKCRALAHLKEWLQKKSFGKLE